MSNKKLLFFIFRFIMALQTAESMLGPLASRYSNILNYLFFDPPTIRIVTRLIIFFYGNRVPCSLAIQLFHACNDDREAFMTDDFYLFYKEYAKNKDSVHMGIYFHMRVEKCISFNWSNESQFEIVEFEDHDISRGFRGR